tara:strand:+ start:195 stop:485 length:291 start_codon:yes stop_codon:yes gene_type:complete
MATEYTWTFPDFEVDSDNKVKVIHWRLKAADGEHIAEIYGSDAQTSEQNFDSITKDEAKECVIEHSNQTEDEMKANLDAQIEAKKNPATVFKSKEW